MLALISSASTERLMLADAVKRLPDDFPSVHIIGSAQLQTEGEVRDWLEGKARNARIFVTRVLGGKSYFEQGFTLLSNFCRKNGCLLLALPGDGNPDAELAAISNVPAADLAAAFEYFRAGGTENFRNLLLFLADIYLSSAYGFATPVSLPNEGFYHPDAPDLLSCAGLELAEFCRRFWKPGGRPTVGVIFYRAYWQSGDLAVVDGLIREIEASGGNALPVFCYSLRDESLGGGSASPIARLFKDDRGATAVDCLISLLSYAAVDIESEGQTVVAKGTTAISELDAPVIQAVTTMHSVAEWLESDAGLPPLDAAMKVVMPEFDGRIIGPLVGFRGTDAEGAARLEGLPERVRACVSLAIRQARLKRIRNGEKRLAIVLTNFANRQGRIGSAVGLDTPASVITLLNALKARGYKVDGIPESGDALMSELISTGGYEQAELTEENRRLVSGRFSKDRYGRWFNEFPLENRDALRAEWGEPPGEAFRDGDDVCVGGRRYGNVFVMLQPPRGFGDNPLTVYHSGDLIPTHHYLGSYRWLRDEFRVDAIIHCGKHGTLEWLPGKGLGLSENCWPELAISDLPVFYPFIINDPGEGTQAKRRMHACIIDHLIPPMARAETYDDLTRLQQLLNAYTHAERVDPDKLPIIQQEIWSTVLAANLHRDLGVDVQPEAGEYGEFLQHIDGYLCEIGDMQVRDGLHVLGVPPVGEILEGFLLALTRLDTPEGLGLRHAVAVDLGLDYASISQAESLGANFNGTGTEWRSRLDPEKPSRTNGDVLNALDSIAGRAVETWGAAHFAANRLPEILSEQRLPTDGQTARTLRFLGEKVVPNLRRTSDELSNLLDGLEGHPIAPGPSGAPTRGMANVLPTGRNFYSVDVRAVPSPFAWEIGRRLGDDALVRYREREGHYPQSVGITIWGTSTMRTQGDDIAEAFWLLGVRPVWQMENRRIDRLEIVSLAELARPRIDVTVRMSGFFRDAFPHVVSLLDQAVNLVADLDEPNELNFVRRNVQAAGGGERARYRLFSNKPGAYGTGILAAITDSNWESEEDLARIYLEWGGFAYTAKSFGEPAHSEFQARLAVTEIALHNQDNREHDIFDSDDYMQFHGGMIAAIRSLSGRAPTAFFGDSSNPEAARNRDLKEEARRVFRARVANPKWLAAMRRHGYKGALEMAATVDYLFGFDATAHVAEDWMYEQVAEKYVFDGASREFLARCNPWALAEMTSRLVEASRRGLWESPPPEVIERLQMIHDEVETSLEMGGGRA
jgi:cobaltochelatase CobN